MKKFFGIAFLLMAFVAPVLAQEHRLSPEDQRRFDSYYSRWQQYRQTNNRGQIASMEERMFDIYARYGIPREVPYERVASNGGEFHDNHDRDHDRYRDHDQEEIMTGTEIMTGIMMPIEAMTVGVGGFLETTSADLIAISLAGNNTARIMIAIRSRVWNDA